MDGEIEEARGPDGLVEGANEVLAVGGVDARLAADAGVHHRQQRRGHLRGGGIWSWRWDVGGSGRRWRGDVVVRETGQGRGPELMQRRGGPFTGNVWII